MNKEETTRAKRRKESMKEALESKDFYDPRPLLGKKADINIIWGQRSNGKTFKNDGKSVLALKKTYEGLKAEKKDVKELFADNAIFWKDIKANFSSNDLLWSKAEPNVEGFLNMALPLSGTTSQTN